LTVGAAGRICWLCWAWSYCWLRTLTDGLRMLVELCCPVTAAGVVCVAVTGVASVATAAAAAPAVVAAAGTDSVATALTVGADCCSYDEEPCLLCAECDGESSWGEMGVGSWATCARLGVEATDAPSVIDLEYWCPAPIGGSAMIWSTGAPGGG
jgi:hypothetical protein